MAATADSAESSIVQFKSCSRCVEVKPLDLFPINREGKFGRASLCRDCKNHSGRVRHASKREEVNKRRRDHAQENRAAVNALARERKAQKRRAAGVKAIGAPMACDSCDAVCIRVGPAQRYCDACQPRMQRKHIKEWAKANIDNVREAGRRKRLRNLDRYREYDRRWKEANRHSINEAERRRMADPKRKLDKNISRAIRASLKSGKGGESWKGLVGYSLDELVRHLESKFLPGMSWDNYGEWHIDHVIPKSVFNYSSPRCIDFRRAWALPNLQPLWASDNRRKGDKVSVPFQPSLGI